MLFKRHYSLFSLVTYSCKSAVLWLMFFSRLSLHPLVTENTIAEKISFPFTENRNPSIYRLDTHKQITIDSNKRPEEKVNNNKI